MVTVNMEQIIDFENSELFTNVNLPLKVAYKLNKIKKNASKEATFYAEKFQEIIDEYAKKDENGELIFSDDNEQILIQPDKIEECNQKLNELQNLEVQIENYNLSIDDFGDDIECTPDELAVVMPFME